MTKGAGKRARTVLVYLLVAIGNNSYGVEVKTVSG